MTEMDARSMAARAATSGLRLARGTADEAVRLTRRWLTTRRAPAPSEPETFTPSRLPDAEAAQAADAPASRRPVRPRAASSAGPNPASVARNIGPRRPSAKAPTTRPRASAPGAKLPTSKATRS